MKRDPASGIQEQPDIKSGWNTKPVMINFCAKPVKDEPGANAYDDIGNNVPPDMYAGLLHQSKRN